MKTLLLVLEYNSTVEWSVYECMSEWVKMHIILFIIKIYIASYSNLYLENNEEIINHNNWNDCFHNTRNFL